MPEKQEVIVPIVHMNGTSEEELLELRRNFLWTIRKARDALTEMSPNGRDYYPTPGLFEKAMEQHRGRDRVLAQIWLDVEKEIGDIMGDDC